MTKIRLYTLSISHPGHAVKAMLDHKRLDYDVIELWPATHPWMIRRRRFSAGTVPAMRIGSRRWQGSREISRALDEISALPPLFPAVPRLRREVIEAERWGEEVLQEVPRRIFRYMCATDPEVRFWLARTSGVPFPSVVAKEHRLAEHFAQRSGATAAAVKADIATIPEHLDRVALLLERGVLGNATPNAADYQIAASIHSLLSLGDIGPYIGLHAAVVWARQLLDPLPGPAPRSLPVTWLVGLRTAPLAAVRHPNGSFDLP